ncbi:glycosyltransferase [Candidatus Bathyarchaeota archaeon]|nr:glycosyltransferase [Candidatus Bathyarchaeota archaeon]
MVVRLPKPIVTLGVCVKNCADTIREAIESIIAQNYPHELMEVIFVDDGSEDETLSMIRTYVQKMKMPVKVFHHEWKGLGPSRNIVVKNATGDCIVWVDGDMILPKDFIRKQVEFMEQNPKVGIAGGNLTIYKGSNLVATLENIVSVAYSIRYGKKAKNLPGTGGAIYRVKAIRQVGGFDERIKGSAEDVDVAFRIKSAGWLVYRDVAFFQEGAEDTWKALWKKYFWHGYGGHYTFHKHKSVVRIYGMVPPVTFGIGLMYATVAYKLTCRKVFFLLPFHYTFKRIAWCLGFMKAHMDGYGH